MSSKEYTMQWDFLCRVCLREGEMYSIFNENDNNKKEISIYDKIVKCANITLKRGMSLPENICKTCLDDLDAAYRFHINCENSNAILKSFIRGNMTDLIISRNGEKYKYKPPAGLNVKRIKKTITETVTTINTDENNQQTYEIQLETLDNKDEVEDNDDNEDNNLLIDDEFITEDYLEQEQINDNDNDNTIKSEEQIIEYDEKDIKTTESNTIYTIKPVKSNKGSARGRKKASSTSSTGTKKEKVKILPTKDITLKPDGSAIIRIRKCEEEKPLKICEICGNTYKYKHALESHMRRHRNEKPFACEICGRAFVINFELRRHMRTHTGQKPYACRYCGRKFSDFGSRIKHERTHTGERPYACETCGKAFSYSHVLQSHILTHTGERRYECLVCGRRFTKSHHLKAHTKIHNKNQNNSVVVKQPIETVRSAVAASTSTSSLVATSTWSTTDNNILNSVLLNNEEKMIIETTEDEQVYFHTGDDNVFVIKQEKMEKEENLDLNQR